MMWWITFWWCMEHQKYCGKRFLMERNARDYAIRRADESGFGIYCPMKVYLAHLCVYTGGGYRGTAINSKEWCDPNIEKVDNPDEEGRLVFFQQVMLAKADEIFNKKVV